MKMQAYFITYAQFGTINTCMMTAPSEQEAIDLVCNERDVLPSDIHRVEVCASLPVGPAPLTPDDLFRFWTPDAVAECLAVSDETYRALWHIVANQPSREFCETPDALWDRYALVRFWDQLDPTAQADCNRAAEAQRKYLES